MTQEEKSLLLQDLCARLPYGVICACEKYNGQLKSVCPDGDYCFLQISPYAIETIKPYLRPMSSMTDEEREEWADLFMKPICELEQYIDEKEAQDMAPILYGKSHSLSIDWLNKRHFDYHGLIEQGLALIAPEGMYNIKEK